MSAPSQSTTIAIILTISILIVTLSIILICWWHRLLCFSIPTVANNHNRWNLKPRDRYQYSDGYTNGRDYDYGHRTPQGRQWYQDDVRDLGLPRYQEACWYPGRDKLRGEDRWGVVETGWAGVRGGLDGGRVYGYGG